MNLYTSTSWWEGEKEGPPDTIQELYYLGQFIEGQDYWSGSIDADPFYGMIINELTFTDVCAVISTGDPAADPGICQDLGISVAGIPFVAPTTDADVAYPPDFPALPTF